VQYVFLIYADEVAVAALRPERRAEIVAGHMAVYGSLVERGVLRYGAPLTDSPVTRTLGPDGTFTDGPYAEGRNR
jgi:hypothetical protein